ncbi:MAG: c-type cytochrome [Verrucomicrobiales bacterium]|nr:c-type cytochrome [Verrucomicrobiales bacterium]
MKSTLTIFLILLSGLTFAQEKRAKIVFISGKPSHGPMAHEHRAGNMILAKRLNESGLPVEAIVLPDVGYPKDPAVLNDAATIVIFCTGHKGHLLNPKLAEFDAIMKKGTGVVMIHWATEAEFGPPAKKFLEWMGGYCALNWSVNPHWEPEFKTFPDHPISRGLTTFSLNDEWYYHMKFVPELKGVTPILSAVPGLETLKRPDGARSGNPDVRKAVASGESQHVAWAYDRPDGKGRGFGFTGAHNHKSWQDDNFRTVVLNAICWTAHVEVPENGVPSGTPTDDELQQNLDPKGKPKPKVPPKPKVEIPDLSAARQSMMEKMDVVASMKTLTAALQKSDDATTQAALLSGMLLGLEGQRDVAPPAEWEAVSTKLTQSDDGEVRSFTMRLSQIFGDESATGKALILLADRKAPMAERRAALASLLNQQNEALRPILKKLIDEKPLRIPAIRAFSTIETKDAPKILLRRYPEFKPDTQRAVIETLTTRKSYAEALFAALEAGEISREAIPAYVARSLSVLLGEKFTRKYGVKKLSDDKEALIAKTKELATAEALEKADASAGRVVYQKACLACHKMYGQGGVIGPDLTGSNRADLNYLLLNILDPSGDIPDAYKMVIVKLKNGQLLSGTVTAEDDQKVTLNMIGQQSVIVKSDIVSRETAPVSMMPEGLLQTLTEKEILDLFKYMQTKEQVDLPK